MEIVANISSFLDALLTRHLQNGSDLRKEVSFRKDLLASGLLNLETIRRSHRDMRAADLRELENTVELTDLRWNERLLRIVEWQNSAASLQQQQAQQQRIVQAIVWFQKADVHKDAFIRRLSHRAALWQDQQKQFHQELKEWSGTLSQKQEDLQEFKQKGADKVERLLVSRARKKPELDFVKAHSAKSDLLAYALQQLRRSINHSLGRIQSAYAALEIRANENQVFFEIHKDEIQAALKPCEKTFLEHREAILSDALLYESCKRQLRWIQETVNGLRCIEDFYHPPEPFWKKFFRFTA